MKREVLIQIPYNLYVGTPFNFKNGQRLLFADWDKLGQLCMSSIAAAK